jgi:hypothetical protein
VTELKHPFLPTSDLPKPENKLTAKKKISEHPDVVKMAKQLYFADEMEKRTPKQEKKAGICCELSLDALEESRESQLPRIQILGCEEVRPEDMERPCDEELLGNLCEIYAQRYRCGNPCTCCCLGVIAGHAIMSLQEAFKAKYYPDPTEAELVQMYIHPTVQHIIAIGLLETIPLSKEQRVDDPAPPPRMAMT